MKHISRNQVLLTKLTLLPRIPLQNVALGSPAHSEIKLEEIQNIKICTRIIFSKVLKAFMKAINGFSASYFLFIDPTLQIFPPLEAMKEENTKHQNIQIATPSKDMDTVSKSIVCSASTFYN